MRANALNLNFTGEFEDAIARQLVGHTVAEVERVLILKTLDHFEGNRTHASATLGISVRCLRDKIRQFKTFGVPVTAPSTTAGGRKR